MAERCRSYFACWHTGRGARRIPGARSGITAVIVLGSLTVSSAFRSPSNSLLIKQSIPAASGLQPNCRLTFPLHHEATASRKHRSSHKGSELIMSASSEGRSQKGGSWFRDSVSGVAQRLLQPFMRLAAIFLMWIRSLLIMRSAWLMQVMITFPCIYRNLLYFCSRCWLKVAGCLLSDMWLNSWSAFYRSLPKWSSWSWTQEDSWTNRRKCRLSVKKCKPGLTTWITRRPRCKWARESTWTYACQDHNYIRLSRIPRLWCAHSSMRAAKKKCKRFFLVVSSDT